MRLYAGHNYVKLNTNPEFYQYMHDLTDGNVSWDDDSWSPLGDYGFPNDTGYPISDFHFKSLPPGTVIKNLTKNFFYTKYNDYRPFHSPTGQGHMYLLSSNNTGLKWSQVYKNEGCFILGDEYDIIIPTRHEESMINASSFALGGNNGNGGGVDTQNPCDYGPGYCSDLMEASVHLQRRVTDISAESISPMQAYQFSCNFLTHIEERQRSVLPYQEFDSLDWESSDEGAGVSHYSYWCVYGGEPMLANDHPTFRYLTPGPEGIGQLDLVVQEFSEGKVWNIDAYGDQGQYGTGWAQNHFLQNIPGQWGWQAPPGICGITWAGHTAGFVSACTTNNSVGPFHSSDDGLGVKPIQEKHLIGPDLTPEFLSPFHYKANSTAHIDVIAFYGNRGTEEALQEVFFNDSNNAIMRSENVSNGSHLPQVKFIQHPDQPTATYPSGGPNRFDVVSGDGYYTGDNANLYGTDIPQVWLQPGNIYRIDVRFPWSDPTLKAGGSIRLGNDWARLLYSNDPVGTTGRVGEGRPHGNQRKTLEFLPYLKDGGKDNFQLTSWKTNPNSSVSIVGNNEDLQPIFFEDYNKYDGPNDISPQYPQGVINSVDVVWWNNVGRSDIVQYLTQAIVGNEPMPAYKNPVYFEDFDQAGSTTVNEYGYNGDGILNSVDVIWWAQRGRQDIADMLTGFITSGQMPPSRTTIDPGEFLGGENANGGIFNLSSSMDGDYSTHLIQNGQLDTPDYVFNTLPSLPLQPWGLRYFEDFKAFSAGTLDFDGAFEDGNALLSWGEDTYLTATMQDSYDDPIGAVFTHNAAAYRGGITDEWQGNLDTIELGQYYDIRLRPGITGTYVFRNKFIDNESQYGPHTVVMSPGQWHTVRFSLVDADDDITFGEDDISAWHQISIETGQYTGHVQDWIRRYISAREGGYNTNITTFNQNYLPRSPSGHAENGPLKPGYIPPLPMGQYPMLPPGIAYLQDTMAQLGNPTFFSTQFAAIGYPEYGEWLSSFTSDPNFFSHIPPQSPYGDEPVFGPYAILAGNMRYLSQGTNPQLKNALGGVYTKRKPTSKWGPVGGQELQLPYSSGSYAVQFNYDAEDQAISANGTFVCFGSQPNDDGTYTLNSTDVAVYYKGSENSFGNANYIAEGWYCPDNSPIFDDGVQEGKPYYIQHQLPYSIFLVNPRLDLQKMALGYTGGSLVEGGDEQHQAYNVGLVPSSSLMAGTPYVEIPPRVATKVFFMPISGEQSELWYSPGNGSGLLNEWIYTGNSLPLLRKGMNYRVPYHRDEPISVSEVVNHIAFPKGQIPFIQEEPLYNENGTYASDPGHSVNPGSTSNASWPYAYYAPQEDSWLGELDTFKPGRTYRIGSQSPTEIIWPFFGKRYEGSNENLGTQVRNYFPHQPIGVDEWSDFDIDGDGIVSVDDWNIWLNPPSGPAREDIAEYIQIFLTTEPWRIYFAEPPVETDPVISAQINLEDINISLLSTDNQPKTNITEVDVSKGYFNGNSTVLLGSQIHTASMAESNKDYYITVTDGHATSSNADSLFSVSYGHYRGSGSYVGTDKKGASEAIYKQHLSVLEDIKKLDSERTPNIHQDVARTFNIGSGSLGPSVAEGDDYVYILSFDRKRFGDKLREGTWVLNLSGSLRDGKGTTLSLTDDSEIRDAVQTVAGPRYNIVSGSRGNIISNDRQKFEGAVRGWFYPHQERIATARSALLKLINLL